MPPPYPQRPGPMRPPQFTNIPQGPPQGQPPQNDGSEWVPQSHQQRQLSDEELMEYQAQRQLNAFMREAAHTCVPLALKLLEISNPDDADTKSARETAVAVLNKYFTAHLG